MPPSLPLNAGALLAGRVVGAAAGLGLASLVAHRLGGPQFGRFAAILAAGFLANTAITFGTDTVLVRAVAARTEDADVQIAAVLRFQLRAAAGLSVVFVLISVVGQASLGWALQGLALIPMAVTTVAGAVLRGRQRMVAAAGAPLVGVLVALVISLGTVTSESGVWVPVAAVAVGHGVTAGLLAGWAHLRIQTLGAAPVSHHRRPNVVRQSWVFAAMVLSTAVASQIGLLILDAVGHHETGGYAAGLRLAEAARLVPAAAFGALFPAMFDGIHRSDRYRTVIRALQAYAAGAAAVLIVFAGPISAFLFDGVAGGATHIRILGTGVLFVIVRLRMSFELIAQEAERSVLISSLAGGSVAVLAAVGGAVVGRAWIVGAGHVAGIGLTVAILFGFWHRSPGPAMPDATR